MDRIFKPKEDPSTTEISKERTDEIVADQQVRRPPIRPEEPKENPSGKVPYDERHPDGRALPGEESQPASPEKSKAEKVKENLTNAEKSTDAKVAELSKEKGYFASKLESLAKNKKLPLLLAAGLVGLTIALPVGGVVAGCYGMGLAQALIGHGILYGAGAEFYGAASVAAGTLGATWAMPKIIKELLGKKEATPEAVKTATPEPVKPVVPEAVKPITPEVAPVSEPVKPATPEAAKPVAPEVVPASQPINPEGKAEDIDKKIEALEARLAKFEKAIETIEAGLNNLKDIAGNDRAELEKLKEGRGGSKKTGEKAEPATEKSSTEATEEEVKKGKSEKVDDKDLHDLISQKIKTYRGDNPKNTIPNDNKHLLRHFVSEIYGLKDEEYNDKPLNSLEDIKINKLVREFDDGNVTTEEFYEELSKIIRK